MNRLLSLLRLTLMLGIAVGFAACSTTMVVPPSVDMAYFEPLSKSQRIMESSRINWQPRQDVHTLCARITGIPITPYSLPMACAYWNVVRKECTVITGREYGINYLGHEARHCFEGNFHP